MRADARRNLERVLRAARDLIVERGPNVPYDDIARRAGVGSGTLYRRFPERDGLLHAVALDALTGTAEAARAAAAEAADPFDALSRYLRATLDLRVSAVLPALLGTVDLEDDPELGPLRTEVLGLVEGFVAAAQKAGTLPADVTFADIGMMAVRIARPLPGPLPPEDNHALAHRHLDLFVRGLRAQASGPQQE